MDKKKRIRELETELAILENELFCKVETGSYHARHNKKVRRYNAIIKELAELKKPVTLIDRIREVFK